MSELDEAIEIVRGWNGLYPDVDDRAARVLAVAIERVREALQRDLWSDHDPHGQLQRYLDALEGNPS